MPNTFLAHEPRAIGTSFGWLARPFSRIGPILAATPDASEVTSADEYRSPPEAAATDCSAASGAETPRQVHRDHAGAEAAPAGEDQEDPRQVGDQGGAAARRMAHSRAVHQLTAPDSTEEDPNEYAAIHHARGWMEGGKAVTRTHWPAIVFRQTQGLPSTSARGGLACVIVAVQ